MATKTAASPCARLQGDCLSSRPEAESTALRLGLGWPSNPLGPTDVREAM